MDDYFFGHSDLELERLIAQSNVLRPITERLLRNAGLKPGARILDLGCGAGDVSMLAAELTGSTGWVVGIDQAPGAIDRANHRAKQAGFGNVAFHVATEKDFAADDLFDVVIGRYIVLHQADPAGFIRRAAARVKPGGILAFHEIDMRSTTVTLPVAPFFDEVGRELMEAIRTGVPHPDAAARLLSLFAEAGLPEPTLTCERPVAGAHSNLCRWVAATLCVVRDLRPERGEGLDLDRLEADLMAETAQANSQILGPEQYTAWCRV